MADKPKSITKSALLQDLATGTGLTRKQVAAVFAELSKCIKKELGKKGPGVMNIFGLVKVERRIRPARKAGEIPDRFHPGQMMKVKARPATTVVKVRPLKELKNSV